MLSKIRFRLKPQVRLSLRSNLILLVLLGMIPLALFSTAMVFRLARAERETFERGAAQRTLALMTAVDTELKGYIATLQALATSSHLDTGRFDDFRRDAERALKDQPDWFNLNLALPSAQQLINLRPPSGAELGTVAEHSSFDHLVRTGTPVVSNLELGPWKRRIAFAVRVPVVRDGVLKYVLSAAVKPQAISALLARQRIPPDWIAVVLDGNRKFVARTVKPDSDLGRIASQSFRAALDRAPEGWFRDQTSEGREVYTPYNRSPLTGWTVGIGIPVAAVEATFRRSLFYMIFVGMALLLAGIALAWAFSNRSSRSIQALVRMTERLGLDKEPPATAKNIPTDIAEIETLRAAFLSAARLIDDRSNERDRVEASLRRVSQRLELAQEAANICTFERNLETNEIICSPSFEKLYGIQPGGFGGTYEDWRRFVHPDDIAAVEQTVSDRIGNNRPIDVEYRIIRPDGTLRWVAGRGRIVTDGEPRRIVGVNIDITDRKRADETMRRAKELSEALNRINEALHSTLKFDEIMQRLVDTAAGVLESETCAVSLRRDGGWIVSHVNGMPANMIGARMTDDEERHAVLAIQSGEPIAVADAWRDSRLNSDHLRKHNIRAVLVTPLIARDRPMGVMFFNYHSAPRAFTETEVNFVRQLGATAAIALENARLFDQREQAEQALREADRRKDEFLAMLGHELRNPLNVITTSLELLSSQDEGEALAPELRETMASQISHMVQLVDDLLDVSRITHGQIRLELRPCDFTALVRATVEEHRRLFATAGIDLTAELPEQPLWVLGDPTRLKQVIGNALQNANKFTDRGGSVAVSLRKANEEGSAVLTISDSGIGMNQEMLDRAFEPFSQAETSLKRRRGGVGLGLTVLKGLIELHNGQVALNSAGLGKGSKLVIRIPLTAPVTARSVAESPPAERTSRSYRILLIEDNPIGSRTMRMLLNRMGHNVDAARTGQDGIAAARRFQPELVLCDIGLPDMDGFAVAKALRREPVTAKAYLVALTGYGQAEYQRQALEAGFNVHLTKPVDLNTLRELLGRATIPATVTV